MTCATGLRAPDHVNTATLAKALEEQAVLIEPGAPFFTSATPPQNYYRLAYSSIPATRIPDGIALVADAIKAYT